MDEAAVLTEHRQWHQRVVEREACGPEARAGGDPAVVVEAHLVPGHVDGASAELDAVPAPRGPGGWTRSARRDVAAVDRAVRRSSCPSVPWLRGSGTGHDRGCAAAAASEVFGVSRGSFAEY